MTLTRDPGAPSRGPRTGRRRGGRTVLAGGVLATFLALAGWALAASVRSEADPLVGAPLPLLDVTPLPPCPAWAAPRALRPPAVLVYISVSCPFCRAEVAAWAERVGREGGPLPWVILAPDEAPDSTLPGALRSRILLDRSGQVGRVLQVRRVPTTVHVDGAGQIRRRAEGVQSTEQRRRALDEVGGPSSFPSPQECAP